MANKKKKNAAKAETNLDPYALDPYSVRWQYEALTMLPVFPKTSLPRSQKMIKGLCKNGE
jgi:hypothetical protein